MTPERWLRITDIFLRASERAPDGREDFLSEACRDDVSLRRDVDAMLAADARAGQFGETPLVALKAQLEPGFQLGPYCIKRFVGAGGMGEVYLAGDDKLGRDVALKILPDTFAADPDRLARFRREAKILASLSHPNIGHIYGFEDSGTTHALVLELIAGPTLAERIAKGPILLAEALRVAKQIADALEVAHDQGVIHRDLKPANIKLTPSGVVKVLDFGLAKTGAGEVDSSDATDSSPLPVGGTGAGVILGTPAYMSPEQARGQGVDKRTDIWAFGCVLHEMLTGALTFKGATLSDTVVAVLHGEPNWDALPASTPPSVRLLLQRCLEKDPNRRLADIGDARLELDQADSRSGIAAADEEESRLAVVSRRPALHARRWHAAYLTVGLISLAVGLLASGTRRFSSTGRSIPVTSPSEYAQLTDFTDSAVAPSLSPDGRMVTFIRGGEPFLSSGQIYVKVLPGGDSVRLTRDGERKYGPVFTPDGSRIAYTKLAGKGAPPSWDTWTVPVAGGEPTRFLPNASGLTWINDRRVLFAEIRGAALHMGIVTATDSRAESRDVYFPTPDRAMAHFAYGSPDRRSVLVVEMDESHAFHQPCRLVPFDGSSAGRQVGPQGTCTSAAWSPDGTWMYFGARVGGSAHLWRQKFPNGAPEQITFGPTEEEGIALASDGRSLVTSVGTRRSAIWLHDAAGERAISSEGYAVAPRLSRDGSRVFYLFARDLTLSGRGSESSSAELRVMDIASGKSTTLLPGVSVADYDISGDEKEVVFTTINSVGNDSTIWVASLARDTAPHAITRSGDQVSFGPDGELVFRSLREDNALVRIKLDGTGRERITEMPVINKFGMSPDGEWAIAFRPGVGENLPTTFAVPTHGGAPRILCAGPCKAVWSADARFLYVWSNGQANGQDKTFVIPVPAGTSMPDLPPAGLTWDPVPPAMPGTILIDQRVSWPGADPSTYVFTKSDLQRNLFRIPLH